MKDFHSKHLLSLFIGICLLSPLFASALEMSRPAATVSRPSSTSATQPTVNRGQVQQAIPKTKMESGYYVCPETPQGDMAYWQKYRFVVEGTSSREVKQIRILVHPPA